MGQMLVLFNLLGDVYLLEMLSMRNAPKDEDTLLDKRDAR